MICLICSDFPRNLMIETIKTLPLAAKKGNNETNKKGVSKDDKGNIIQTDILFE